MSDQTLIIYDWDDTLFPTSWYGTINKDINLINKNRFYFFIVDASISELLQTSKMYGTVTIVTNGSKSWVHKTLSYLPNTRSYISNNNINIISARDNYENIFHYSEWKKYTYESIIDDNKHIKNLVSIGDDRYEYNALVSLSKLNNNLNYLKAIKLLKNPNIHVLIDQLSTLKTAIGQISIVQKHLDMSFNNKNNNSVNTISKEDIKKKTNIIKESFNPVPYSSEYLEGEVIGENLV